MKSIEINPSNEMHLLRHFKLVSEEYINSIIGKEYSYFDHLSHKFNSGNITKETIDQALKTNGSKFFEGIKGIANPRELSEIIVRKFRVINQNAIKWEESGDKKFFSFLIDYSEPVGFKNLVALASLSSEDQSKVQTVPRGSSGGEESVFIKTVTNVKVEPINTIEVGLTDFQDLPYYFITAYPGDLKVTPDFPSNNQNSEAYERSKEYWDSHVFIV